MRGVDFASMVLIVAASAAGMVPLVRQIPEVRQKMFEGVKPWICDLCMSFWATLFATLFWWCWMNVPLVSVVPAFALTFLIVRKNSDPIGPPPSFELDADGRPPGFPALEDLDEEKK